MKLRKPKSKRLTLKKKHKIIKKVREHNKKMKKNPHKKHPGVPNSYPFKLEILKRLEEDYKKVERESKILTNDEYAKSANQKLAEFENLANINKMQVDEMPRDTEHQSAAYRRNYLRIIDTADVIIEVLDARDPMGTRSQVIENEVLSRGSNKHLILLLNKIDLIPKNITLRWLNYLNKFHTTLVFKSPFSRDKKFKTGKSLNFTQSHRAVQDANICIGAHSLISAIKSIADNLTIMVGVVGFPNVGKSRTVQEFKLTHNISIMDSPGVIESGQDSASSSGSYFSHFIAKNPKFSSYDAAMCLYDSCDHAQLRKILEIPAFNDFDSFLACVSRRFGKLKKGGLPDTDAATKIIVQYCTHGKLRFYYEPPELNQSVSTTIVSELKPRFNIDEVTEELSQFEDITEHMTALKLNEKPIVNHNYDIEIKQQPNPIFLSSVAEQPKNKMILQNRNKKTKKVRFADDTLPESGINPKLVMDID